MNEDIQILPIVIGALGVLYFGYEVEKRRSRLRAVFNVFDKKESAIAESLERLVASGELKPYVPGMSV